LFLLYFIPAFLLHLNCQTFDIVNNTIESITVKYSIFSGTSNIPLAEAIASQLGVSLGKVELRKFSDGEIWCKYDSHIRGRHLFLVQSTHAPADNLMELLIMIDAARRASAESITAVIPYFGYARQDRKDQPRVAIAAKLVANLITVAGADHVIALDLHSEQEQGFFDIPVDHLSGYPLFVDHFRELSEGLVVVSTNIGKIKLARTYAGHLRAEMAIIDRSIMKGRDLHVIGDVEGKNVLLVDDLLDSGKSFESAFNVVRRNGAQRVFGAITHAFLSMGSVERILPLDFEKLMISDSVLLNRYFSDKRIHTITSAKLIANAIHRMMSNESVSSMFVSPKK